MKWEILKGSEKDFEGAPEWATMKCHCTVGDPTEIRNENVAFSDGVVRGSHWVGSFEDDLEGVIHREEQWHVIAERCLITEPDVNQQVTTEWSGDGLPPVGVRCEHLGGGENEWMTVTVIAISERPDSSFTDYWLRTDSGANFIIGNPYRFRPIRSPEDVARDAAAKGLVNFLDMETDRDNPFPMTELIGFYDYVAAGKIPGVKLE